MKLLDSIKKVNCGKTDCKRWAKLQLGIASVLVTEGAIAILELSIVDCAKAQIVPDATLGAESSVVTPQTPGSPIDLIQGGATRDTNLFHSFEQFSVLRGRTAYFNNALGIQNIISRVTGASISNIDGLIRANGSTNLFLINPNGIIFGPNATLSIGGSFLGSTANSLNFADGSIFSATAPQTVPLLTVSVPVGLQYQGNTASSRILNQSRATNSSGGVGLQVLQGKTLTLVGGNVSLEGGLLQAPDGRVQLGGVVEPSTVGLNSDSSLSFPMGVQQADVSLTNGAAINVSGNGSGSIALNARNIDVLGASTLRANREPGLGTVNTQPGDIMLNATDTTTVANNSLITSDVLSSSVGNGGNINITSGSLSVTDGARLTANTFGQGNAGNVNINARNTVSFDGVGSNKLFSGILSAVQGTGMDRRAGNINVIAGSVSMTNGARLVTNTFGQGDAGNVTINARDTVSFNGVGFSLEELSGSQVTLPSGPSSAVFGVGKSGDINITTGSLFVTNGAQIGASTLRTGNAGNVTIDARDTVSLDGPTDGGTVVSLVGLRGVGNGGNVDITTGSLSVRNGAQLVTNTFGQGNAGNVIIDARDTVFLDGSGINRNSELLASGIFSAVAGRGVGSGGNIEVTTGSLFATNGAQLAANTAGQGNAGKITINARDTIFFNGVSILNEPLLSSGVFSVVGNRGRGNGGNIEVTTGSLSAINGARISTDSNGQGNAGKITINTRDTIFLNGGSRGLNNSLSTSGVFSVVGNRGVGTGGNIEVTTGSLSAINGARISTNSNGRGNAGSVTINARDTVSLDGVLRTVSSDGVVRNGNSGGVFSLVEFEGVGNGGDINVTTGSLFAINGARLNAGSAGQGNAGSVNINARDQVFLDGRGSNRNFSGILSTLSLDKINGRNDVNFPGQGGNLTIKTGQLIVQNQATVDASSGRIGNAGDIRVEADSIFLNDGGNIQAKAELSQGGNIDLQVRDLILMRGRDNLISAASGGRGNGGNVTIGNVNNTPLIVAFPDENSDILAQASQGQGGNIDIFTQGIFGLEERNPRTPQTSDINASSDVGIDGTVEINRLDIDPSQGLVTLPAQLVDASNQIAAGCTAGGESVASNKFIITGRGGLPPNPTETLNGEAVLTEWATFKRGVDNRAAAPSTDTVGKSAPTQIVEAQGWTTNSQGEVFLTASAPNVTPNSPGLISTSCNGS